jgi:hypothetical protein
VRARRAAEYVVGITSGLKPHFVAFILLGSLLLGGALAWSAGRGQE